MSHNSRNPRSRQRTRKEFEDYEPNPNDLRPISEYRLQRAAMARASSERLLLEAVRAARADEVSWARIGALVGTSAQAAQQRYGSLSVTA
jgi:hypothetical protein